MRKRIRAVTRGMLSVSDGGVFYLSRPVCLLLICLAGGLTFATPATAVTVPLDHTEALPGGGTAYVYDSPDDSLQPFRLLTLPVGFDAVHASADMLEAYDLPPRPSPAADLAGYANWANKFAYVSTRTPRDTVNMQFSHNPAGWASSNWTGYAVQHQNHDTSQSGANRIDHYIPAAEVTWTEPVLGKGDYVGSAHQEWSIWGGLGGNNAIGDNGGHGDMFDQNGTGQAYDSTHQTPANHWGWIELYGYTGAYLTASDSPIDENEWDAVGGDVIDSYQDFHTTGDGTHWMGGSLDNVTQSNTVLYDTQLNDTQWLYTGGGAEAVGEDVGYPLPGFGSVDLKPINFWVGWPLSSATERRIGWNSFDNAVVGSAYNQLYRWWDSSTGDQYGHSKAHPGNLFATDGGAENAYTLSYDTST